MLLPKNYWFEHKGKASTGGFTYYSYTYQWERKFNVIWTYPTVKEN